MVVGDITNDDVRHKLISETVSKFGQLDILVSDLAFSNCIVPAKK